VLAKKILIIAVDASAGFIVALTGFKMTSFPLDMIWGVFNVWLWIVAPTLILWTENKENAKNLSN